MSASSENHRFTPGALGVLLLVAALWGFNFIVIKVGVAGVPPLFLASLRFVLTALPALLFVKRPPVAWGLLAAYGLFLGVGEFGFLFTAIKLGAPAGLSSIILQAQAFFTALVAAVVLKEKLHLHHLGGMSVAALGLVLIGLSGAGGSAGGLGFGLILMLLLGAFFWAAANVTARKMPGAGGLSLVVWSSLFSPLPLLGLSMVLEGPATVAASMASLSWLSVGALAYLVILSTLVGYGVWNHMIIRYGAGRVAPFSLLVPVFGLTSGALVLGEAFTLWDAAAAVLVLGGLLLHVFGGRLGRKK